MPCGQAANERCSANELPCRPSGHSRRNHLHLHSHPHLGRRWPDMVRRGAARPSGRNCRARSGRKLPAAPPVPEGFRGCGPQPSRRPGGPSYRTWPGGARARPRRADGMHFRRPGRRLPNSSLVRSAAWGRPLLRDGCQRTGAAVGSVLAWAQVPQAGSSALAEATVATEMDLIGDCKHHPRGEGAADGFNLGSQP
jgi:hypothetical protein